MTLYLEIFKKNDKWNIKKNFSRQRYTTETFDTVEAAEQWIEQNVEERFWIDHRINSLRGHLMPLQDWMDGCDDGGFIDYDGCGCLVDENYEFLPRTSVRPSDYTKNRIVFPKEAKYIHWYNR